MCINSSDKHPPDDAFVGIENELSAAGIGALAYWFDESCQTDKAVEFYKKAIAADPEFTEAHYNLGVICSASPDKTEAINCFTKALSLRPDFAEAYIALGMVLSGLNRFEEALVLLEQAVAINPDLTEAHYNMGLILQHMAEYRASLDSFQKALICNPTFASARWLSLLSLPMIYDHDDQIDPLRETFKANLHQLTQNTQLETPEQIEYALQGINTATNFYLQYQGRNDLALQTQYGGLVQAIMKAKYPHWSRELTMPRLNSEEKIRIGYVSSFMCDHTIGKFLSGWVGNHDHDRFQVHCYHMGSTEDATTAHFRKISHNFNHFSCNVEVAAGRIASDRLHILVHTDIGMNTETLQLAAMRLAPIQCKGWGHPVTTGLSTIDYYLSSDLMEPEDAHGHYSETLVRLPNLALCYQPPSLPDQPSTRQALGLPQNRFIFFSSQSIFKYLPRHDDIYPLIALQVPNAYFVFIGHQSRYATRRFRQRLDHNFKRHNLDYRNFCHFTPRMDFKDFLSLNLASDVLLDTFDWSGGKTTLEAIDCGLPVVTCPGRFMRGRHAYAMLRMMGISDTVAHDKDEYIRIAVRLAWDRSYYAGIKKQFIEQRSRLYDDQIFMRELESFYRSIVRPHLDAMPSMGENPSTGTGN